MTQFIKTPWYTAECKDDKRKTILSVTVADEEKTTFHKGDSVIHDEHPEYGKGKIVDFVWVYDFPDPSAPYCIIKWKHKWSYTKERPSWLVKA